ncbi:hypothetical protein [Cellulomonas hominis]
MSVVAVDRLAPPRTRRGSVARTVRHLLAVHLVLSAWFWGIGVVVLAAVVVVVDRFGSIQTSMVQYAQQASMWFPFSLAVLTVSTALAPHVAAGMTRRSFAWATVTVAVVQGVAYAAVTGVLLAVEGLVYRAQGWPHTVEDSLLGWDGDGARIAVHYLVLLVLAPLSGLLVGVVYYRAGGWWGTIALPFTAGPLLLVMTMFSVVTGPLDVGSSTVDGLAGSALVGAVATIAVVLAYVRLARGTTIKGPTA